MRTSTKRWAVIAACVGALVVPPLVVASTTEPPRPVVPITSRCIIAERIRAAGDEEDARKRLREIVADANSTPAEVRCASEGLEPLAGKPSLSAWFADRAQRRIERLATWVTGRPLRLANGSENTLRLLFVLLPFVLALVAVRQFTLWWRALQPGPVRVAELIDETGDKLPKVALATVFAEALGNAGIVPEPAATGELGQALVNATETLAALGGERGKGIGAAITSIARALSPPAGFTVTPVAGLSETGLCQVKCGVVITRTGRTLFSTAPVEADTFQEAAELAAFDLYLRLVRRPSVLRRTPGYLRWSDANALADYQRAVSVLDEGDVETAVELLTGLADTDPAQLQVRLALGTALVAKAQGAPQDVLLTLGSDCPDPDAWIAALDQFCRAALLAPHEVEARLQTAIALSYVDQWWESWLEGDPDRREDLVDLLAQLFDKDHFGQRTFWNLNTQRAIRKLALSHYWRIYLRLYRPPLLRTVVIRNRRALRGRRLLFSRTRKAERDLVIAAFIATKFDRDAASTDWKRSARTRYRLVRLFWVRTSTWFRKRDWERSVRYNTAIAYARLAAQEGISELERTTRHGQAVAQLSRAYRHKDQGLVAKDFSEIYLDTDFAELVDSEPFRQWEKRYLGLSVEDRASAAWAQRWREVRRAADDMTHGWDHHIGDLRAAKSSEGARTLERRLLDRCIADDAAWNALARLCAHPFKSILLEAVLEAVSSFSDNPAAAHAETGSASPRSGEVWTRLVPFVQSRCDANAERTQRLDRRVHAHHVIPRTRVLSAAGHRRQAWSELDVVMTRIATEPAEL